MADVMNGTVLASGHMSAHAADTLAWAVIVVVLICAVRVLLWVLGWR
jgi:hypothetical protein